MFRASWVTFKKNAWVFIGATAIIVIASIGFNYLTKNSNDIFRFVAGIVEIVLLTWLFAGFFRMALDAYAGGSPSIQTLFSSSGEVFGRFAVAWILSWLAFSFGLVLFIIPGIILGVGFMFAPLFVIENGARGIEALRASWSATKGHRWNLFLVSLTLYGFSILGALALGVGLLITMPMVAIALVYLYRELEKKTQPEAAPVSPQVAE